MIKPSIQEVQEYCQERGNSVDPEEFILFYEMKGWYVGKNKMKDWKCAVRLWEVRQRKDAERKKSGIKTDFSGFPPGIHPGSFCKPGESEEACRNRAWQMRR